jgi:hypothetical protein
MSVPVRQGQRDSCSQRTGWSELAEGTISTTDCPMGALTMPSRSQQRRGVFNMRA